MSLSTTAPATDQALRYSSRGSHTVTAKPLNSAMVARYSVSWPAPMSSMRYSGPKVLTNSVAVTLSSLGAALRLWLTVPSFRLTWRCIS